MKTLEKGKLFAAFLLWSIWMIALSSSALASSTVHNESLEIDGVTYTFTLNDADFTAAVTEFQNPETPTVVTVPAQVSCNGNVYTVTELDLVPYISSRKACPNIIGLNLPDTLETVNKSHFANFNLTSITIPGSVKTFEGNFFGSESLTSITFQEGVESINPEGKMITDECPLLTEISLPTTLKALGSGTFSGADGLREVVLPESVTKIPSYAFAYCTSLTHVTAKGKITSIGSFAFSDCPALQRLTADAGELSQIDEFAFVRCKALTSIPDLSRVTQMGQKAFYECRKLSCEVDLSSLNAVPDYAFCYAPVTVTALSSGLTSIGEWAFIWGSFSPTSEDTFAFPETLQSIGTFAFYYAFHYAADIKTIVIPASVTSIASGAFQRAKAEVFEVGSGVTEVADNVFADIEGLQKIIFDNSEDDVSGALPQGVEIVYLRESIRGIGDKISSAPNAMTLQEAVNAAPDGSPATITLSKNVELSKTLNIPAGKIITIRSESGDTLFAAKDSGLDALIFVEAGASVSFDGDLTLSGRYNDGSVINAQGAVALGGNAAVTASRLAKANAGVISVHGSGASLAMDGGRIENNIITGAHSGAVRVSGGASVAIRDGAIRGNKALGTPDSSSGILLYENSSGEMTGGVIEKNSAVRGSAIMLYSYDAKEDGRALFTLSGGTIRENICAGNDAAGAVYVEGNAALTMKDGAITENQGKSGAGVCVLDPGIQTGTGELGASFLMEGGTISNNTASRAGGGIYSYANGVALKAGVISGNRAPMGGGVYSEGNAETYSTLHMENAVITGNSSGNQGGGLWFCSTGSATVYIKNGAAIYGNTAGGAGDDFISVAANTGNDSAVTLADRILGGGKALWYRDGRIYRTSEALIYAATDNSAPRYGQAGADGTPVSVKDNQSNLALKTVVDPTATELARQQASLFITGNTAGSYGGGVAANGGIVIGEFTNDLINIPVTKLWMHGQNPQAAHPASVTVRLMLGQTVMDTLVLNQANQWTGTFFDLPRSGGYTIAEETAANYTVSIAGNAENGFTLTNIYTPPRGHLTVSKTISSPSPDTARDFTFTVTLSDLSVSGAYGDMLFENGVAVFQLKHGQSKTASGLKAGISYTVVESDNDGYTVTAAGKTGVIQENLTSEAVFVNTENIPIIPETGDSSTPSLWGALLLLPALGAAGLALHSRKKQRE